jgi:sulfur-oxidizing protein SoxY
MICMRRGTSRGAARRAKSPTLLLSLLALPLLALGDTQQTPNAGVWPTLRPHFYGTRSISEVGDALMSVEAPASTPDPSATPVTIHFGEELAATLKQVRVIIDNNPSPLVATFDMTPTLPVDQIDLRVRIDRFTSVRAIAETTDGHLEMRSTWVNASGGCSTPPSAASGGTLGEIRFRPSSGGKALQVSIRHPNNSGFQIDPRTGDAIAPHFISHITLRAGEKTLLAADTGISLSENPTLRIAAATPFPAPVTVEATDIPTQALYTATWNP